MEQPFYILQISDLHIKRRRWFDNKESKEEAGWREITKTLCQSPKYHAANTALLITGDVVDNGLQEEYKIFEYYLNQLQARFDKIMILPGNHDYSYKGNFVNPKSVAYFRDTFLQGGGFPQKMELSSDVLVLGLDTMMGELHKPLAQLWADGEIGAQQLQALQACLQASKHRVKVVAMHHHPFALHKDRVPDVAEKVFDQIFFRLDDKIKFLEIVLDCQVNCILFGHHHKHIDQIHPDYIRRIYKNIQIQREKSLSEDTDRLPLFLSNGKSTERAPRMIHRKADFLKNKFETKEDKTSPLGLWGRELALEGYAIRVSHLNLESPKG